MSTIPGVGSVLIGFVREVPVTTRPVLVVGLSGSSGAQYGIRLLRVLHELGSREIHLVISRGAEKTLRLEAGTEPSELYPLADHVHEPDEMAASVSSGSFLTDGMVVCPCSMRTLAAIATGNADSLSDTRRRRVPQGAPSVSAGDQGDAAQPHPPPQHGHRHRGRCRPPFYHQPTTIEDLVDQTVGKVLDQFGIEHQTFRRWNGA